MLVRISLVLLASAVVCGVRGEDVEVNPSDLNLEDGVCNGVESADCSLSLWQLRGQQKTSVVQEHQEEAGTAAEEAADKDGDGDDQQQNKPKHHFGWR
mmetsp:Transcript_35508/g.89462  ORF Transcript_35508/g.89462 Transcript_35508/m.89462 type:complete len:98 (-) Transcript_35508:134-427(-)